MTPRTSILTATRNRPVYLAEAIASVRAQTDRDFEHLIYDDGSTDLRVGEVLREARAQDPDRVRIFRGVEPLGRPARIWNLLAKRSRGEYITILDDDNRKHREFLAKMIASMEANGSVGAVSCGWLRVDEAGKEIEPCHWNQATSEVNLWRSNTIDSNALCFRREVLDQVGWFPTYLDMCEDWHFVIRLTRSVKMVHLPDILLDYREHAGAASHRGDDSGMLVNRERVRQELFPQGPPPGALVGAKSVSWRGE